MNTLFLYLVTLSAALYSTSVGATASPFATRVLAYDPAPGQFVRSSDYNDPSRALGAPVGGGLYAADNSKVVTLGGFGGSITLGFDAPIVNLPPTAENPRGLDFILFGNAFFITVDGEYRFAEAAVVEVSADINHNGLADDPWYLIPGSALAGGPWPRARVSKTWDTNVADATYSPASAAWIPLSRSGTWTTSAYLLPTSQFTTPVYFGVSGIGAALGTWGYADCSPTLALGDIDGDGVIDDPAADPTVFYTRPSDPITPPSGGVATGSGGGDAFDITWAVDPSTGQPAGLTQVDFVRVTTAVDAIVPFFGEVSSEVSGVARVLVLGRANAADIAYGDGEPLPPYGLPGGFNPDGPDGGDFDCFFNHYFSAAPENAVCDIAYGDGEPMPPFGRSGGFNPGVDGGDFDCFFNYYFQ